ncbi:28 kDa ribonucleoprotein, chloroplastic-like [Cucurbita moschata]|uniref:28 kDa ribonucleoprotein, chloroplastic-like n=2 Tax=Cucurbita TaxID=3660 RepID=A0A6J1FF97_CUCMO
MALVRLPCSSSSLFLRSNQQNLVFISPLSCPQNPSYSNNGDIKLSLSRSSSSLFSTPLGHNPLASIRAKRTRKFVFQLASTSQDDAVASSSSDAEEFSRNRLLAQNVPWDSTPEDIRSLFEKYGTVVDVELSMYNKIRNRGLAFVTMGSPEEALAAVNNLESYEFGGRTLKLNYAKVKKEKPSPPVKPNPVTFNLFVANLPFDARAKDLREFFDSGSGNVVSAQIIFHENPRRSSGYGFVAFKTKKDAEAAISEFQGKNFMGRSLRVARSKQFVKLPSEEKSQSEDTSTDGVELASAAAEV